MEYKLKIINCLLAGIIFLPVISSLSFSSSIENNYFRAIDQAEPQLFQREFEYPFTILLNKEQKEHYEKLESLTSRKFFMKMYWRQQNPNPLLEQNEWLQTFLARLTFVKQNFTISKPPYFDDRGEYYLKYGKPLTRYTQQAHRKNVSLFLNKNLADFIDSLGTHGPIDQVPKYYQVYGNESWVYEYIADNRYEQAVIHFVEDGEAFREVDSMADFIDGLKRPRYKVWFWADLIKERANALQAPALFHAAQDIWNFENNLRAAYESVYDSKANKDPNPKRKPPIEGVFRMAVHNPFQALNEQRNQHEAVVYNSNMMLPIATFEPDRAVNDILFKNRINQFRGPNNSTRLDITLLSPLKDNFIQEEENGYSTEKLVLEYNSLFRDQYLNPIWRDTTRRKFPIKLAIEAQFENVVGNFELLARPEKGELTLQIVNIMFEQIGFRRQELTIRDFNSEQLMLSDIQFLTLVNNNQQRKVWPTKKIEGLILAPYPYYEIHKSLPLFSYVEIYNIQKSGFADEYKILLKVIRQSEGQKGISRLNPFSSSPAASAVQIEHTRTVTENTARELVALNFEKLEPGNYRLEIIVVDPLNSKNYAQIQQDVVIAKD